MRAGCKCEKRLVTMGHCCYDMHPCQFFQTDHRLDQCVTVSADQQISRFQCQELFSQEAHLFLVRLTSWFSVMLPLLYELPLQLHLGRSWQVVKMNTTRIKMLKKMLDNFLEDKEDERRRDHPDGYMWPLHAVQFCCGIRKSSEGKSFWSSWNSGKRSALGNPVDNL